VGWTPPRSWWTRSTWCGSATSWSTTSAAACNKPPSGTAARKGDRLYGIRRLLLTGAERLSERGRQHIAAGLAAGDRDDEVWYAHVVKEQLRAVYRADDEDTARAALAEFYDVAHAAGIPECSRLAKTIRRWQDEVLAYYRSDGLSNARTEAVNALMKKIQRIGHGFRNLHNYRLRLLLHCGGVTWQDQPPRGYGSVLPE
jgi:transposase